jgi:alkylated DNA repair dioxygenase AlkB
MTPSLLATGELQLTKRLYAPEQCAGYLQRLIHGIRWNEDHHVVAGRRFEIPRLQAWHADDGISYSYSNNLLQNQPWVEPLLEIRRDVEARLGEHFNAVLLTYYRDGDDHVTWHADDERELGPRPVIASLSLGTTRELHYRHKTDGTAGSLSLDDGDLLLMQPEFQLQWEHCVPSAPAIREPRINLTFRNVVGEE